MVAGLQCGHRLSLYVLMLYLAGSNTFGLKSKHGYFLSFDKDNVRRPSRHHALTIAKGHVRAKQDSAGGDDKRSSLFHFRAVDSNAAAALLTLSQQKNAGLISRLFVRIRISIVACT